MIDRPASFWASGRAGHSATLLALLGATVFTACVAGERLEEMSESLVGVQARDLRSCVGIPVDTHVDGDTEYLTFRWFGEGDESSLLREGGFSRPRLPGRSPERSSPLLDPEESVPQGIGYCELVFEVREGRVRHVEAEGRSPSGLNEDAACVRRARGCLRPATERQRAGS